jgi:hypothetical protein
VKKNRSSLRKFINAGATIYDKWERAFYGGPPPTKIQSLALRAPCSRFAPGLEPEWLPEVNEGLKKEFADLLFPALLNDDPAPFQELLAAMAKERSRIVSCKNGFVLYKKQSLSGRDAVTRKLGTEIPLLSPDDLISREAVMRALQKREIPGEEKAVFNAMRDLGVRLLKPGDMAYFGFRADLSKPIEVVRYFVVQKNRTINNHGMSRKKYDALNGEKHFRIALAGTGR